MEGQCSLERTYVNPQTNETTQKKFDFVVAEDRMEQRFSLPETHYKVKIEFMLMRIDDWEDDRLHMYVNDLLVMDKKFSRFGNRMCFEEN